MVKWLVASGVVLVLVGALVWQLRKPPPAQVATTESRPAGGGQAAGPAGSGQPAGAGQGSRPGVPTDGSAAAALALDAGPAPVVKLDPRSEDFNRAVDVAIPARIRAGVAACYRGGLDPDRTAKIAYRLHIAGGQVTVSEPRLVKSELGDAALERCMVEAVGRAGWRDDSLPDFDERAELFIRLRSLDKYRDPDEQNADSVH